MLGKGQVTPPNLVLTLQKGFFYRLVRPQMQPRQVRPIRAVYLDTCVISGQVKGELAATECAALEVVLRAYHSRRIDLVRSDTVDREISEIPQQYRAPHSALLATFLSIPMVQVGGLTRLGALGLPQTNPSRALWRRLEAILPDPNDRLHVFAASKNRVRFFVTVDHRTILSRKERLLSATGVTAVLPSEFVSHPDSPLSDA